MNYTNLFNTLHSEAISEDVKEDIVSKILDKVVFANEDLLAESINESNDKIAPYVEALSLLVNSDITNEALEEAIDEIFANETQEVLDSVTEAFKEDIVRGILVEQLLEEEGLNEESTPIGLAALRRKWGEEPIPSLKKDTNKAPKTEAKSPLYVMKSSDGTYRGGKTQELKSAVLKARAQKPTSKAQVPQPNKAEKQKAKVEVNKAKTTASLEKTGSSRPIELGGKVEQAKASRANRIKNSTLKAVGIAPSDKVKPISGNKPESDATLSNARRSVGIDPFEKTQLKRPETKEEKVERLEGNPGAQAAVKHSKKKADNGQLSLFDKSTKEKDKEENKEEVKPTKKRGRPRKNVTTSTEERSGAKKNANTPVAETPKEESIDNKSSKKNEGNSKTTKTPKSSKVYLKGGNEPSSKKFTNYEASDLEKDLYSMRQDLKDMRELGEKDTPKYKAMKAKYEELKKTKVPAHESLISSLTTLFASNISESSLKEICEMVAASKKNADRVIKRNNDRFDNVMNKVNKQLEITKQMDPELVKQVEEIGAKKEAFERRYNKKFNKKS